MKFGQLMEYNLKFFAQNMVEKLVPDPFLKKAKLSISLDQQSKVSYNLFIFFVQVEDYQNILNLRCRPMVLLHVKPF